jgi:protein-disulfide isomerase
VRTKSLSPWLCLCVALAAAGCGGGNGSDADAERRHAELLAAIQKLTDAQADVARRAKSTNSKVDAMVARGVMVIPPGGTWETKPGLLIPSGHSPAKGPEDASVRVVEFADFECPYCRANAGLADALLADFPGEVQFIFKHYPLRKKHKNADAAARASIAAAREGKFWEMHDLIFSTGRLDPDDLREHARALGLDMEKFEDVMTNPATGLVIMRDRTLARDVGATGTPTFFVNGKLVEGGTYESVASAVRAELRYLDKHAKRNQRALRMPAIKGDADPAADDAEDDAGDDEAGARPPTAPAGAPSAATEPGESAGSPAQGGDASGAS